MLSFLMFGHASVSSFMSSEICLIFWSWFLDELWIRFATFPLNRTISFRTFLNSFDSGTKLRRKKKRASYYYN